MVSVLIRPLARVHASRTEPSMKPHSENYLRRQSPLVSTESGHVTPFGAPAEQITETKISPSSHETVFCPITMRS
jgi:hypothetical protein